MNRPHDISTYSSLPTPQAGEEALGADSLDSTQAYSPVGSTDDAPQTIRLVAVLDEYLSQLKNGTAPDRETLLAAHPELAEQLAGCLAGLEFIHKASEASETRPPLSLGDFRIIREVGKGGMGAVYEAEQISLRRHVALKILRFSGVSDPDAIKRFQREAETVATLHHTNIVPIFAVGSEKGVNYYAMQFIDGQSLDQVLRERSSRGERLPYKTVVQWGLQAAEALAHAHARGVIHRDVKPSNLLIDANEDRVWLTDFGLAKKTDDVTLSLAGALLGTPRYMSPEQATATNHQVDHRTDIYSLGASLYELLTGQALFCGESPHQLISQILTTDPTPPRQYRPDLPRDLETILLKCLSKDARQRYNSASLLADDLRAFLDGRAIAARRASLIERTARWMKRQKRSVALTASAVAATLLLVVLSLAGGYAWKRSRLAFVMLKSDRPPLVAQWVDGDEQVIPPATIPTQNRLEVPTGEYQLHLSSHHRLSQTYDVRLKPGQHFEHKLDLNDQLLWSDIKVDRTYQLARFDQRPVNREATTEPSDTVPSTLPISQSSSSRTDVISLTQDGLHCLLGSNGESGWSLDLLARQHRLLKEQVRLIWPWDSFGTSVYSRGLGAFDERPMIVSQADSADSLFMDFNSDGYSDLVLATQNQAIVLAIDGQDGEPLWVVARGEAVSAEDPTVGQVHQRLGAILYSPQLVIDQDGDAVDDLLIAHITLKSEQAPATRSVELISGASGSSLWLYELPDEAFALPPSESVPYGLRWFHGQGGGYSSGGGGFLLANQSYVREHPHLERSGPHHYLPTQPIVIDSASGAASVDESPDSHVALIAGRQLVLLDLRKGLPVADQSDVASTVEIEIRPAIQPIAADFDGDREPDLLLVEPLPPQNVSAQQQPSQVQLVVWSIAKQECLWKHRVTVSEPRQPAMDVPQPNWPIVVDVDRDGAAEVITPSDCSEGVSNWGAPPWGKLAMLDGRTGEPRWQRQLFTMDQRVEHFIAGPDVNNDSIREIFVASLWGTEDTAFEKSLFIDCLSGADGQTVWRTRQPLTGLESSNSNLWFNNLQWYGDGADGWPQLIVAMRRGDAETVDRSYLFSAGTGRMTQVAMDVTEIQSGDFDTDGIEDLLLYSRSSGQSLTQGGWLQAIRGVGSEAWRRIPESSMVMVGDLDSDGVRDLVTKQSRKSFEAISGATGTTLWQNDVRSPSLVELHTSAAREQHGGNPMHASERDINGDGVPDLILASHRGNTQYPRPLLLALSGKTGQTLWESEAVGQVITGVAWQECRDLDNDGNSEIIMVAAFDKGEPLRQSFGSDEANLWLVVASGQTGRTQWAEPLTSAATGAAGRNYRFEDVHLEASYIDLDADGVLDIILPAQRSPHDLALETRAISGKDGRTHWGAPLPIDSDARESLANTAPPAVADVDGDGKPEVVIVSLVERRTEDGRIENLVQLELLDGVSGHALWTWNSLADRWGNQASHRRGRPDDRLRAVLVRRPTGGHWIAVRFWNKNQELHVIDELGQTVSHTTQLASFDHIQNRVWAIDVDGDGGDELIMLTQSELIMVRPNQLETPLWHLPVKTMGWTQILGVTERARMDDGADKGLRLSSAPTVIVQAGRDRNSVYGIDAATGDYLWTSVGPAMPPSLHDEPPANLLNVPSELMPPHVSFQFQSQVLTRRGVLVGRSLSESDAKTRMPLPAGPNSHTRFAFERPLSSWQTFSRRDRIIPALTEDPRLLRPLPWKPADYELERMPSFIGWCAFYGITLAVVPVTCLFFALRRRQWSLRLMLTWAPAAAIVTLGIISVGPGRDFETFTSKLIVAYFVAGPVFLTIIVFGRWLTLGRWRGIALWLGLASLVTIIMMTLSMGGTYWSGANPLQPGERYRWDGWYWMAPPVFYLATWALSLGVFVNGCAQRCRQFLLHPSTSENLNNVSSGN